MQADFLDIGDTIGIFHLLLLQLFPLQKDIQEQNGFLRIKVLR